MKAVSEWDICTVVPRLTESYMERKAVHHSYHSQAARDSAIPMLKSNQTDKIILNRARAFFDTDQKGTTIYNGPYAHACLQIQ